MKLSTCFFNKQNQSIRTADALLRSVTASPVELGAGALDALAIGTLGEYLPGFLGLVSLSSRSWYLHSTVPRRHGRSTPAPCASRHALVPGFFLWSSSVRRSRVRTGHLQRPLTPFLFLTKKDQEKTDRTHSVIFAVALTEPTWIWTTIQIKSYRNWISFSCHMSLRLYFFPFPPFPLFVR